jgi:hypothetical protein
MAKSAIFKQFFGTRNCECSDKKGFGNFAFVPRTTRDNPTSLLQSVKNFLECAPLSYFWPMSLTEKYLDPFKDFGFKKLFASGRDFRTRPLRKIQDFRSRKSRNCDD